MLHLATKLAPERAGLERAYRAGFRYAEFWLDQQLLADWASIAELAQEFAMSYAVHFPTRGDLGQSMVRHAALLCGKLDCSVMVMHQPMFNRYADLLLTTNPTLRLAVENQVLDPAQFQNWAETNAYLTLDVEHLWKFTLRDAPLELLLEQVQNFLIQYGLKTVHVHLPGYLPGAAEHRPMYCGREMVFPVLAMLAEYGFAGLIVSEVDLKFQNASDLNRDILLFESWQKLRTPVKSQSRNREGNSIISRSGDVVAEQR